ncbi:MAG: hypothetical protein ABH950_07485 [Candidatus Altiarchaeota archaeon]
MIDEWNPKKGVRLDVLRKIIDDIDADPFFQSILTEPAKHFGLIPTMGDDFQFALVAPEGEERLEIDEELEEKIVKGLDEIMLRRVGEKTRF